MFFLRKGKSMKAQEQKVGEVVPVNFVRVETELRKYPMHLLQSQGSDLKEITICDVGAEGNEIVRWSVMFTAKEGPPGPLAYRIDRLIIDKVIDEQSRSGSIPEILRLGTLNNIRNVLGLEYSGKNNKNITTALLQLQGTVIDMKGGAHTRFTRYDTIVFTGEELPDGTRADAVYLSISKGYQAILRKSVRRPLDYEYLRALPPAAARLYEIISSRIFGALSKGGNNPEARILYSEFCELSALTRYTIQWEMKKQMQRINESHLASGYISKVTYDVRTDRHGKPDWMMNYIPGPKAWQEYKAARKRGEISAPAEIISMGNARPIPGNTTSVSVSKHVISEPLQPELPLPTAPLTVDQKLAGRLAEAGVSYVVAQDLVRDHRDSALTWLDVHDSGLLPKTVRNPGAYIAKAVLDDTPPPPGYAKKKEGTVRAGRASHHVAVKRDEDAANLEWGRNELSALNSYLNGLSIEEVESFDRAVLEGLEPGVQKMLGLMKNGSQAHKATLDGYRLKHWQKMKNHR